MLTRIVHNSPKLCAFPDPLSESLSEPQRRHLRDLCDALLVCESEHTLAALQRQFVETTDASNWADFLRITGRPERYALSQSTDRLGNLKRGKKWAS